MSEKQSQKYKKKTSANPKSHHSFLGDAAPTEANEERSQTDSRPLSVNPDTHVYQSVLNSTEKSEEQSRVHQKLPSVNSEVKVYYSLLSDVNPTQICDNVSEDVIEEENPRDPRSSSFNPDTHVYQTVRKSTEMSEEQRQKDRKLLSFDPEVKVYYSLLGNIKPTRMCEDVSREKTPRDYRPPSVNPDTHVYQSVLEIAEKREEQSRKDRELPSVNPDIPVYYSIPSNAIPSVNPDVPRYYSVPRDIIPAVDPDVPRYRSLPRHITSNQMYEDVSEEKSQRVPTSPSYHFYHVLEDPAHANLPPPYADTIMHQRVFREQVDSSTRGAEQDGPHGATNFAEAACKDQAPRTCSTREKLFWTVVIVIIVLVIILLSMNVWAVSTIM